MSTQHQHLVDPFARPIVIFRWIVFLLAAGYMLRQIVFDANYLMPGGPFRFLTIWALCLSFFVASRQLAFSERRSTKVWERTVAVTVVINAMVVALYWRLYLTNPALVNSGTPIWYIEYYLHLLGPALQWIDALFVFGAFQRWWRAILPLSVVFLAYILWMELFVSRFNTTPIGSVTDGFPYPFLNSLTFDERLSFYVTTAVQMFVVLGIFAALAWVIRWIMIRRSRPQEAR